MGTNGIGARPWSAIVPCMDHSISLACGSRHFSSRQADSAGLPRPGGSVYTMADTAAGVARGCNVGGLRGTAGRGSAKQR
jgi:hypothetical protein